VCPGAASDRPPAYVRRGGTSEALFAAGIPQTVPTKTFNHDPAWVLANRVVRSMQMVGADPIVAPRAVQAGDLGGTLRLAPSISVSFVGSGDRCPPRNLPNFLSVFLTGRGLATSFNHFRPPLVAKVAQRSTPTHRHHPRTR